MGLGKGRQDSQGLEHFACEERLRELGLSSPEKGRSGGPHPSLPVPTRRIWRIQSQALHCGAWWEDRENGRKVKEERFSQDIRKAFFAMSSGKCLNRSPREAVQSLSLGIFQLGLNQALNNLI